MVQEVREAKSQNVLGNGLKLVGEMIVPGAAQLLEGRIGSGLVHSLVAGGAVVLLGGASPFLAGLISLGARANSFSLAVNNRNLWETNGSAPTPSHSEPSQKP